MRLVTFFNVLELPEKNRKGGCNNPPWLDEGLVLRGSNQGQHWWVRKDQRSRVRGWDMTYNVTAKVRGRHTLTSKESW